MTQEIASTEFQAAFGTPPSEKQNLPELQVGPLCATDINLVSISENVPAVPVVAHQPGSMASPYLYVPALNQPRHPLRAQSQNGQWFELEKSVDLRHFGRVIDNRGADIGPALRNFVAYAKEKGGGSVVIPPGLFSLESPVNETLDLPNENIGIGIFGHGTELSRIVVDGASTNFGIYFNATNRAAFFQFEKFSLLAEGRVAGRPLRATMPLGGSRRNCSHIIRDLLVQGYDAHMNAGKPQDDHFASGFDFSGAWRMVYENNHVSGPIPPVGVKVLNDWSDSSILWRMSDGLLMDGAYAPIVRDAQFYFVGTPVICRGSQPWDDNPPAIEAERALFHNVRCPTCKTGIFWHRDGAEPELVITDCFFDFRDYGVNIKGSRLGQVFRNAFFQKTDTDNSRTRPADIRLDHCIDFLVDRNFHHESGDRRRRAVLLLDTSTAQGHRTTGIEIRRNRLSEVGVIDYFLFKGSGVGKVLYEPGEFAGSIVGEIDDLTADAPALLELPEPYRMELTATSGQNVASGAWTSLTWDTPVEADDKVVNALAAPGADVITVPTHRGITRAQMRVNATFASHGTGDRRLEVLKNGAPVTTGLTLTTRAVAGAPSALAGVSDWIPVTGGDILSVRVRQGSGQVLAMQSPTVLTLSFR